MIIDSDYQLRSFQLRSKTLRERWAGNMSVSRGDKQIWIDDCTGRDNVQCLDRDTVGLTQHIDSCLSNVCSFKWPIEQCGQHTLWFTSFLVT